MEELSDLVARSQAGDMDAYGKIVNRFEDMAYGYAYSLLGDSHLAEDAAQEAFISAYRGLSDLKDRARFAGWFRRIVFTSCQRLTRRARVPTVPLESVAEMPSAHGEPSAEAEKREIREVILAAIRSLPEVERTAMTLFYINGYSQSEVADFLEVPVTAVNNRLHASRRRLKERVMDMVKETLRQDAPAADEMSERVTFLLSFAERLGRGEPITSVLEGLAKVVKSASIKRVIADMQQALKSPGCRLSKVFGKYPSLFPPMVIALIEDGESSGSLQHTARLAGEWMRTKGKKG